MKKSLGKLVLLFVVLLQIQLLASQYEWTAHTNKTEAKIDEAIYLSYSCEFSDRARLYVIDFNPVTTNENYTIKLLSESEHIVDNRRVNSYEFVAFVHKAGQMAFEFDVAMKKTNEDSIQNSVLGRDNGEYEEYAIRLIRQKTLSVNILEMQSKFVGKMQMNIKADTPTTQSYEPFHFEVSINGIGNLHELKPLSFEIEGVKIFTEKPKTELKLTKDGYRGTWSQKFAFVSDKSFKVAEFKMSYFDLETQAKKELISNEIDVIVNEVYKKEDLLDEDEQAFRFNFEYIYYFLTFIAGFLASKIKIKSRKKESSKDGLFREKIKNMKSLEELSMSLILEDESKYREVIEQINDNGVTSLKQAQKIVEKLI